MKLDLKQYTRYLGELLMIFIAVMAAFFVEEWREIQKREQLENEILKELKSNLLSDIVDFDINIEIANNGSNSARILNQVVKNNLPYHDSLGMHFSSVFSIFMNLVNTSAFDNLSNMGFDIIKNDSLRQNIQTLYGMNYKHLESLDVFVSDHLIHRVLAFLEKNFESFSPFDPVVPRNPELLWKDQELLYQINTTNRIREFHLERTILQKQLTLELINMIDREIEVRF